jgi:hypothetical protein
MSQAAWKATIKKLEKRAAQLQEEYDDLACTHDLLACRESVYNAWCQGISVLDHLAAGTPATRKALGSCYPQLAALQQQEQLLMQQLTDSSTETAHHMMEQLQPEEEEDEDDTHPAACGAFDAGVETIAPLSDPLQYFRQIAVQPRMPEAASMTVVDLSQLYKSVVMDMSMQLHLLHNGFEVVSEDQAVLRIKAGMDRCVCPRCQQGGCSLARTGSRRLTGLLARVQQPLQLADRQHTHTPHARMYACMQYTRGPRACLPVLTTCPSAACHHWLPSLIHLAGTSKP